MQLYFIVIVCFVCQGKRTDGIRAATNAAGNFYRLLLKICSFSTATTTTATTECAKCPKMSGGLKSSPAAESDLAV